MLDLGFVSAILANHSYRGVIDFAAENKFKCVEIMCWPKGKAERRYAGVTHIDVAGLKKSAAREIIQYASDRGIYISGLGYYPNPLDPDPTKARFYVEHIKKEIGRAHV